MPLTHPAKREESHVYSLGATRYFLLVGKDGISGREQAEVMHQVCNIPFPKLAEHLANVPSALDEFIARCVDRDPSNRPADGAALVDGYQALAETLGLSTKADLADEQATPTLLGVSMVSPPPEQTLLRIQASLSAGELTLPMAPGGELSGEETIARVEAAGASDTAERKARRLSPFLMLFMLCVALASLGWWFREPLRALLLSGSGPATSNVAVMLDGPQPVNNDLFCHERTILLTGRVVNPMTQRIRLTVDGEEVEYRLDEDGGFSVDVSVSAGQAHSVSLAADGLSEPLAFDVIHDDVPPQMSVVKPAGRNPSLAAERFDLELLIKDDHLELVTIGSRILKTNPQGHWVAKGLHLKNEGANSFIVDAVDLAGNSSSLRVIVHRAPDAEPVRSQPVVEQTTAAADKPKSRVATDTERPVIAIASPSQGARRVSAKSFDLVVSVTDEHLVDVAVGSREATKNAAGHWLVQDMALPREGENRFTVTAKDRSGNSSSQPLTMVRDTTAPKLLSVSPPPGSLLVPGSMLTVSFKLSEVPISLSLQGQAFQVTGRELTASLKVPGQAGVWKIKMEACDDLGNCATYAVSNDVTSPPEPGPSLGLEPWRWTKGQPAPQVEGFTLVGDNDEDYPEYDKDLGDGVLMRFVLVPAGSFMMGRPSSEAGLFLDDNELPSHRVSLDAFDGENRVHAAAVASGPGRQPFALQGCRSRRTGGASVLGRRPGFRAEDAAGSAERGSVGVRGQGRERGGASRPVIIDRLGPRQHGCRDPFRWRETGQRIRPARCHWQCLGVVRGHISLGLLRCTGQRLGLG